MRCVVSSAWSLNGDTTLNGRGLGTGVPTIASEM